MATDLTSAPHDEIAAKLQASEDRYRTLFEAMDEGFCVIEAVPRDDGGPPDLVFREVNRAFAAHTGLSEVIGRTAREFLPSYEAHWQAIFARVGETGQAERSEHFCAELDRWYRTHHSRIGGPGSRLFALVFEDISERKRAEQALRDSEQRLKTLLDTLPVGVGLVDLDGRLLLSNQEMLRYLPSGVMPSRDPPRQSRWLARDADGAVVTPRDYPGARALRGERVVPGMEMLYTPDSGPPAWVRVAAVPAHDADGKLTGQFAVIMDIDHLKRAQERQDVLLAELQHRVRNILGMVRSIARRTAEGAESAEEMHQHLEGRIDALARTQVLLTRRAGAGVDLGSLIHEELRAQIADESRLEVVGPPVTLAPKAAEVLTLAVHELATNSIKYGALKEERGQLAIHWKLARENAEDWLRLEWSEAGVRVASTAPRRAGFGTDLITRRVPYELSGRGSLEIRPGGVVCRIEFPLTDGESILDRIQLLS